MNLEVERARVVEGASQEELHFGTRTGSSTTCSPHDVCRRIGLNWMSAIELSDQDWLSFDPRQTDALTAPQEAELTFLGTLVSAGCCDGVMRTLLRDLRKPYAYQLRQMHYNWLERSWHLNTQTRPMDEHFTEWLEELVSWGDLRLLERAQDRIEDAVSHLRSRQGLRARSTIMRGGTGDRF